jgi:hypothetical protein
MIRSRNARTRAAAHAHGDGERELGRSWSVSGACADGPTEQTLRLCKKVALASTTVECRAASRTRRHGRVRPLAKGSRWRPLR